MSTTDNRVVEMQFNNKNFESNVKTTLNSLDSLKKGLNLESSAKSLSNLDKAGKSFSLDGIASGVEALSSKFSAMGIVGITVFQNLTNAALNAGKRIVSSLTIDPIKQGFSSYETKVNAIKTVMSGTGETIDQVTKSLNELNEYSDRTVYSFQDMTANISKFTNAGLSSEAAATSIKGISNVAALSGANTQEAARAMYNFGQALSQGSVRLMDWKSIENANMATVEFKTQLLDAAVAAGTMSKSADGMYKTLKGTAVSATKGFNESLEQQWLTTTVLNNTLADYASETTDIGKKASLAATELKTLTQLMDNLADSAKTGWTKSWTAIIGDNEQATKLFTSIGAAIGNITGPIDDARNSMLEFWNANGGRDAIIQAFTNAFIGLGSVIKPIVTGFREIFPAMTGEKLVSFSKALENLTAKFKMSDTDAENLKRTFKGLFVLLDIGKQLFVAVAKGVGDLIGYFLPATGGVLSFTGSIGDLIVSFDEALKSSGSFTKALEKIEEFLKPLGDGIKTAVQKIKDAISSLWEMDTSAADAFTGSLERHFEPLTAIATFVKNVVKKIGEAVAKVAPIFAAFATKVGDALKQIHQNLVDNMNSASFDSIFDLLSGTLFAGILLGIKKFMSSLTKITDGAGGILSGITGILDGVKDSLKAYQQQIKAGTLLKIATAIAILAASLAVLASIDSEKLAGALVAMGVLMVELFGSMGVFEKIMGSAGFKGIKKVATSMIALSIALLILSKAMKNLAELDWNGIAKGLTSIAAMSAILVGVAKLLSQNSGSMIKGATGFVIFAAAILVLTEAVKKLGALDAETLTKGLIGVGVVITELALFMKITDLNGMGLLKGAGILLLATAVNVLAVAVGKFGAMDTGAMIKGLAAVGVVLAELAIFVNLTGDSKRVITTALGLTILAAAMLIFAQAIGTMGNFSWEQIGKGLTTMAGALAAVVVAMRLMPKGMIAQSVALIGIATALVILSNALSTMGGMSWESIAKGLVTLAGSLTIIAIAMKLMTGALPGAAALLVISAALTILAGVLKTLGSMSLGEIGTALLALVGVFAVLGVSALVLAPLTPVLLALGVAIALLGVGCVAVGVGLLAFSAGLSALAISGAAGAAALVVVVTTIIGLIPMVLTQIAQGLVDFANVIAKSGPTILAAITTVLMSLLQAIATVTPKLISTVTDIIVKMLASLKKILPKIVDLAVETLKSVIKGITRLIPDIVELGVTIVEAFLDAILELVPDIVTTGIQILARLLQGIADNIGDVVVSAVNIVTSFLDALGTELPRIVDAGFKMIINLINGIADAIDQNYQQLIDAGRHLMSVIIKAAGAAITELWGDISGFGANIINGIIEGVKGGVTALKDAVKSAAGKALDAAKNFLGIHSPSKVFQDEVGKMIALGTAKGIEKNSKEAETAVEKMSKAIYDTAKDWMDERKFYNNLTLEEELYTWEKVANDENVILEDRKKAEKEAYTVRKEIEDAQYQNSLDWIQKKKDYDQLSLAEELAAWKRVQSRYAEGTDKRETADLKIYNLEKEINSKNEEYSKKITELQNEANEKRKSLEDDYYAKTKEINQKLVDDIKSVNDEYESAVKSRANTLYSTYGLFDEVTASDAVTGETLIKNLQSQVDAFESWQKNIDSLSAKNIDKDLLSELQDMGPKSAAQIDAINSMSDEELAKYVELWKHKHADAKNQAIGELEDLKAQSTLKIQELQAQTAIDLANLNTTYQTSLTELNNSTATQLAQLQSEWAQAIGGVANNTTSTMSTLASNISTIVGASNTDTETAVATLATTLAATLGTMSGDLTGIIATTTQAMAAKFQEQNWYYVGVNIVKGIERGVIAEAQQLAREAAAAAYRALQAAKAALGIASPSKAFMEVGRFSILGFAEGLRKFSGLSENAASDVGTSATSALQSSISKISDAISGNLDLSPTITPVLDLSDLVANAGKIGTLINGNTGVNVTSATNKATSISKALVNDDGTPTTGIGKTAGGTAFSFTQNNYSPKALSRIEIYRQTKNQFSELKGLVGA